MFTPLFQALIAFCAFFSFQFGLLYFVLDAKINPIKKDISKLEAGQANLEAGQANLEARIAKLEIGQVNLEAKIGKLEVKIDKLLSK